MALVVLVVVPEQLVAFDVTEELRGHFEVVTAANLHEAFVQIDARETEICAVVTGLLVPGTGGVFQRPRLLWERVPSAARIILSKESAEAAQILTDVTSISDAHAVVRQPWPPGELLGVLQRPFEKLSQQEFDAPVPTAVVRRSALLDSGTFAAFERFREQRRIKGASADTIPEMAAMTAPTIYQEESVDAEITVEEPSGFQPPKRPPADTLMDMPAMPQQAMVSGEIGEKPRSPVAVPKDPKLT